MSGETSSAVARVEAYVGGTADPMNGMAVIKWLGELPPEGSLLYLSAHPAEPPRRMGGEAERDAFYAACAEFADTTGHKASMLDVWLMARGVLGTDGRLNAPGAEPPRTSDGAVELPELPAPKQWTLNGTFFSPEQMQDYARAAVAQVLKGQAAQPGAADLTDHQTAAIDLLTSQGWVQAADALRTHFLGGEPGRAAP